jgi:hypothetical protein
MLSPNQNYGRTGSNIDPGGTLVAIMMPSGGKTSVAGPLFPSASQRVLIGARKSFQEAKNGRYKLA